MNKQNSRPISDLASLLTSSEEPKPEKRKIKFLHEYEPQALELLKNKGKYQGISTGYTGIDDRMGSFLPGELITIGGDTGHGKSLLAMNIAQNVYEKYQEPVLFINLELTVEQAVQRFYELGGNEHDYAGIMVQTQSDVNYKDVAGLMAEAKEEGVKLVVVDHLHFFDDSIGDNAAAAITRVMKYFKKCAVKFELPVIVLSHVTPQTRLTPDGIEQVKPELHSFKNSKSIEQISDMVGFVFRNQKDTRYLEFYMCKNRSRELKNQPVEMIQDDWRLMELTDWKE
jgi:replicative DNA helicase